MLIRINYFLSLLLVYTETITLEDYCKLDTQNTPCKYKCERSSRCGDSDQPYQALTDAQRDIVVEHHNKHRESVAAGEYAKINLPAASDMKVMSYDKECEFIAGCYIKQCIFDHDAVRLSVKGEYMGQNLYTMSSMVKQSMDEKIIERGISSWFKEHSLITPEMGESFMSSFRMTFETGHFTQVVWPSTEYVGCAMMTYKDGGMFKYNLFCNYKPPGNQPGKPFYTAGEATCEKNSQYGHLCGKIRPLSEDYYKPPIDMSAGISLHPMKLSFLVACGLIIVYSIK